MKEILKFYLRLFKYNDMIGSIAAEDNNCEDTEVTIDRYIVIADNIKKYIEGILNQDDLDITCDDDNENKIEKVNLTNEMRV